MINIISILFHKLVNVKIKTNIWTRESACNVIKSVKLVTESLTTIAYHVLILFYCKCPQWNVYLLVLLTNFNITMFAHLAIKHVFPAHVKLIYAVNRVFLHYNLHKTTLANVLRKGIIIAMVYAENVIYSVWLVMGSMIIIVFLVKKCIYSK